MSSVVKIREQCPRCERYGYNDECAVCGGAGAVTEIAEPITFPKRLHEYAIERVEWAVTSALEWEKHSSPRCAARRIAHALSFIDAARSAGPAGCTRLVQVHGGVDAALAKEIVHLVAQKLREHADVLGGPRARCGYEPTATERELYSLADAIDTF